MEEKKYDDINDISDLELELIRSLSQMECIDDGVFPMVDFIIDEDIAE